LVAPFGLVRFWLAARGVFVAGPDDPPIRLALAFAVPILLFLVALLLFPSWRALVVSVSPDRARKTVGDIKPMPLNVAPSTVPIHIILSLLPGVFETPLYEFGV
jgi:hypothetical protein